MGKGLEAKVQYRWSVRVKGMEGGKSQARAEKIIRDPTVKDFKYQVPNFEL